MIPCTFLKGQNEINDVNCRVNLRRRKRYPKTPADATTKPLMSDLTAHPCDPVEMRRLNFQTPAMISHPPITIAELSAHTDRLKANDNLKFSHEYEVSQPTL